MKFNKSKYILRINYSMRNVKQHLNLHSHPLETLTVILENFPKNLSLNSELLNDEILKGHLSRQLRRVRAR